MLSLFELCFIKLFEYSCQYEINSTINKLFGDIPDKIIMTNYCNFRSRLPYLNDKKILKRHVQFNEYYYTYTGPELIKATLNNNDCLLKIKEIYGINNNWNCKLWKVNDIFESESIGKELYLEFKSANGRIHWNKMKIQHLDEIMNSPLFSPFHEKYNMA